MARAYGMPPGCLSAALSGEQPAILLFEIGGEGTGADGGEDFVAGPVAAAIEFFARARSGIGHGFEGVHQFALALRLEYVASEQFGLEIG